MEEVFFDAVTSRVVVWIFSIPNLKHAYSKKKEIFISDFKSIQH